MTPLERTAFVLALLEAKREGGLPRAPRGYQIATDIEGRVRRGADRASRMIRRGVDRALDEYRRRDTANNRRVNMQNAERIRREGYNIRPDFRERSLSITRQITSAGVRDRAGTGVNRWRGAYSEAARLRREDAIARVGDAVGRAHAPRRLPGDAPAAEPRIPRDSYAPGDRTWRRVERARDQRARLLRPPSKTTEPRSGVGTRRIPAGSNSSPASSETTQSRTRLPGEYGAGSRRTRR